ncbi:Uncharacterized protein dnm_019710 [Desulfonema magnum]|uniref:Uncharacterized protein n=1 Tax=Desulfonema magnum TaxID=45655 RepID=A0A975BHQ6_9BACT|nr:Uncharacterized protein dnm_019710 [Desulfonema magnum]
MVQSVDRKVFRLSQGGRGRNPAFSGGKASRPEKKAGFLCCPAHNPETF